uniref:Src homology 2 domain containing transforming protein D, a n=1 Tax=Paramormyrops kingsleyae TaxID=1676925 RepID=A0A3B3S8X6_9TELE
MAKWLKDYLSFSSRRAPPQPPKPDYTESEILRAYRAQKNLDFEDPYEDAENRARNESVMSDLTHHGLGSPLKSVGTDVKMVSPKHRLIKVDSQDARVSSHSRDRICALLSDTDYSDPFDARLDLRPMRPGMELLQRGVERQKGVPQLYDTPYEERVRGRSLCRLGVLDGGRESRLPRDDERPADEYDQPWEWKKDNISKAFAVQFDGGDWERPSLQYRKNPPVPLGERVDPTLPLEKQIWYHGALSRSEAEALLTLCKECSYLVRNSQTSRLDYSLSLRSCQGFMHMKFTLSKEGKYILGQNSPPFNTIPEVIHYYTTHKLPIRGAEHLSLLFPVMVQTL